MRALRFAALALAVTGCAPVAGMRPASGLMPDRKLEVGGAGALVGPRPYVDEPTRAAGQVWVSGSPQRKLTLTGIAAFDLTALALGGAARLDLLRTYRVAAGPEFELGLLWSAFSLPCAVRLFDETWIYTAPRIGTRGVTWAVEAPAGLSVRIYGGLMARAEYRVSWGELSYYQRRDIAGLALALQF